MNVWLAAATVLLAGLVEDARVALELASTLVTVVLVLLAEGFHRSSYFTLPLVLAGIGFVGALVFVRFLGERRP